MVSRTCCRSYRRSIGNLLFDCFDCCTLSCVLFQHTTKAGRLMSHQGAYQPAGSYIFIGFSFSFHSTFIPSCAANTYLRDFLRDTMTTAAMMHNAAIMIAMIIPTGVLSPVLVWLPPFAPGSPPFEGSSFFTCLLLKTI